MKKLTLKLTFFIVTSSSPALTYDRIVTVGGDITEIVFVLGKGEKVVATDTTSYNREALKLPKVGYKRTLSTEGLLSLKPDLIIHSAGAGPESVIKQLQDLDVELLSVNDSNYTFEGIISKVKVIADKLDAKDKASEIISELESKRDDLKNMLSNADENKMKSGLFILTHAGPKGLVAGDESSADSLMTLAGVKNIADKFKGFKPINPESMINLNPDFIIASKTSNDVEKEELIQKIKKIPGVLETSAGQNNNFIFIETGRYLSFGPSTVEAAIELYKEVYKSE